MLGFIELLAAGLGVGFNRLEQTIIRSYAKQRIMLSIDVITLRAAVSNLISSGGMKRDCSPTGNRQAHLTT